MAVGVFGRAHLGQEQDVLVNSRAAVAVAADQEIGEHRRIVEQLDVLERPRDTGRMAEARVVLKRARAAELGYFGRRQWRDLNTREEDAPAARLVEARDH